MAHPSLGSHSLANHALTPHHQPHNFGSHHSFVAAASGSSNPCLTATVAKQLQMIESSSVNHLNHTHNQSNNPSHPTGTWTFPNSRLTAMTPAVLGQHPHHSFRSSVSHHPLSFSSSHVSHHHQVAALHAIHALHESLMFPSPAVPSDSLPSMSSLPSSSIQQSSPTTSSSTTVSSMAASTSSTSSVPSSISPSATSYSSSTMMQDNNMNGGLVLYSPCLDGSSSSSSNCSSNNFLDVHKGKAIRLRVKVLVPVQDHPNVSIDPFFPAFFFFWEA